MGTEERNTSETTEVTVRHNSKFVKFLSFIERKYLEKIINIQTAFSVVGLL